MASACALAIISGIIIFILNSRKICGFFQFAFSQERPQRQTASCCCRLAAVAQRKKAFSGSAPTRENVFGAARRPRQTQNKNNSSAEDGQSAAEAILNRHIS